MGRKSKVEKSDRRDAVLMMLRKEESGALIARRYGISEATLYRWRDDFIAAGTTALAGHKPGDDQLRQENRQLKKEIEKREQVIGEFTIANRILKKKVDGSI